MSVVFEAVSSSNVRAIGYDKSTKQLYVQYDSGTYIYEDVAEDTYAELMSAESKGKFMRSRIMPHHKFTRA